MMGRKKTGSVSELRWKLGEVGYAMRMAMLADLPKNKPKPRKENLYRKEAARKRRWRKWRSHLFHRKLAQRFRADTVLRIRKPWGQTRSGKGYSVTALAIEVLARNPTLMHESRYIHQQIAQQPKPTWKNVCGFLRKAEQRGLVRSRTWGVDEPGAPVPHANANAPRLTWIITEAGLEFARIFV